MFFLKYPSLSISLRTLHAVGATPPTLSLTICSIHSLHDFIILQSYLFLLNLNANWVATEPQAIYCYEERRVTAQCQLQTTADCFCLGLYECRLQRGIQAGTFLPAVSSSLLWRPCTALCFHHVCCILPSELKYFAKYLVDKTLSLDMLMALMAEGTKFKDISITFKASICSHHFNTLGRRERVRM